MAGRNGLSHIWFPPMNKKIVPALAGAAILMNSVMSSCVESGEANSEEFEYVVDRFADVEILRYRVPGFEDHLSFHPIRYTQPPQDF